MVAVMKLRPIIRLGDLAYIPLSSADDPDYAVIDWDDVDLVSDTNWCNDGRYARPTRKGDDGHMHRRIIPDAGIVDHINGDRLDNRRSNLRNVTTQQNLLNQVRHRDPSWACIEKMRSGRWGARLSHRWLGSFDTKEEARVAYRQALQKAQHP